MAAAPVRFPKASRTSRLYTAATTVSREPDLSVSPGPAYHGHLARVQESLWCLLNPEILAEFSPAGVVDTRTPGTCLLEAACRARFEHESRFFALPTLRLDCIF